MNSMLDEVKVPPDPKLFICPCCKFGFNTIETYLAHLNELAALGQIAIKKAEAKK